MAARQGGRPGRQDHGPQNLLEIIYRDFAVRARSLVILRGYGTSSPSVVARDRLPPASHHHHVARATATASATRPGPREGPVAVRGSEGPHRDDRRYRTPTTSPSPSPSSRPSSSSTPSPSPHAPGQSTPPPPSTAWCCWATAACAGGPSDPSGSRPARPPVRLMIFFFGK